MIRELKLFAGTGFALLTALASADPITFTYKADAAQGSVNGVAFGPGATVVITLTGETSAAAACTLRAVAGNCIPATSGTLSIDNGATSTAITGLNGIQICATPDGQWVGPCVNGTALYSLGNINVSSGGTVSLTASSGPFAYAAGATHTHPSGPGTTFFSVAAGPVQMFNPETINTAASVVSWVVAAASPTLGEWAKITFALLLVGSGVYYLRRRQA
nr:hypothetical protein [uncultured Roseateles sp.]